MQLHVTELEPLTIVAEALFAPEQPDDHAKRFVLLVALAHRVDAERMSIGGQCPGSRAEHRAAFRHVIELRHALGDVERVVVGQRDDAGAEHDALAALAGGGEEHLRRRDHLPAGRVMLAAPEFVVAEAIELRDEVEVALELEHGVLTERMVWRQKGAELETVHNRVLQAEYSDDEGLPFAGTLSSEGWAAGGRSR